jgi:putative copper export protein
MREFMLIIHFIGLAMGVGGSFSLLILRLSTSKMEHKEALKFKLNSFALSKLVHTGLLLLVVSGIYLIIPYWQVLLSLPLLIVKLILVIILLIIVIIIRSKVKKAKLGDAKRHLPKVALLGKIALGLGLTIIVLAVYVFR